VSVALYWEYRKQTTKDDNWRKDATLAQTIDLNFWDSDCEEHLPADATQGVLSSRRSRNT
jgi:hypothetical protein